MTVDIFVPLAGEHSPFLPLPPGFRRWAEPLDLSGFPSEAALAERVLGRMEPWFTVQREVPGTHCSGRRLRIDAILRPRDPENWASGAETRIGVEFKNPAVLLGGKDHTRWAAQAIDYGHVDWDGHGRMYVFICPGNHLRLDWGLLGQFGVGELTLRRAYGLTLSLQHHHRMWSERDGVVSGKVWHLAGPRSGNR